MRLRILDAADEARRRLERDLHDGAQQRLVEVALDLRLARAHLDGGPREGVRMLDLAIAHLREASAELREFARGVHPVALTDGGLEAALPGLARRCPVPVRVVGVPAGRLASCVESAAYFVVSEALTNVARSSGATCAWLRLERVLDGLVVEVGDDGRGGADPEAGTGLRGLADRLAAVDGTLSLESPAGEGTTVRAVIPCAW